jgi:aspartate aminotransferase-like enzyme
MRTDNEILIFPSSGSGALESVVVNLFSPGDAILCVASGVFGERMARIAEAFGLRVLRLSGEWNTSVDADAVARVLGSRDGAAIKAVCLPHNETSTGVRNDVRAISQVVAAKNPAALLVVDAVSSLACMPLETDVWGVDVVVSGSQKGLMLPPGLGIVSVSRRALEAAGASTMPRWYFDYQAVRESLASGLFPYTPATSLLFGLQESLRILLDEGIERVWERHRLIAEAVRTIVGQWGLHPFVTDRDAYSHSVTSVYLPGGVSFPDLSELLKRTFNVEIGGGLDKLKGQILRIGHMGSLCALDVYTVMGAIEMALHQLGCAIELGTASRVIDDALVDRIP